MMIRKERKGKQAKQTSKNRDKTTKIRPKITTTKTKTSFWKTTKTFFVVVFGDFVNYDLEKGWFSVNFGWMNQKQNFVVIF